jgi:hypothetical protein
MKGNPFSKKICRPPAIIIKSTRHSAINKNCEGFFGRINASLHQLLLTALIVHA